MFSTKEFVYFLCFFVIFSISQSKELFDIKEIDKQGLIDLGFKISENNIEYLEIVKEENPNKMKLSKKVVISNNSINFRLIKANELKSKDFAAASMHKANPPKFIVSKFKQNVFSYFSKFSQSAFQLHENINNNFENVDSLYCYHYSQEIKGQKWDLYFWFEKIKANDITIANPKEILSNNPNNHSQEQDANHNHQINDNSQSLSLNLANFVDFSVYPNPITNSNAKFAFSSINSNQISAKVFDISGNEKFTICENQSTAMGKNEIPFDASQLEAGVYAIVCQSNGNPVSIVKFIVSK